MDVFPFLLCAALMAAFGVSFFREEAAYQKSCAAYSRLKKRSRGR